MVYETEFDVFCAWLKKERAGTVLTANQMHYCEANLNGVSVASVGGVFDERGLSASLTLINEFRLR